MPFANNSGVGFHKEDVELVHVSNELNKFFQNVLFFI